MKNKNIKTKSVNVIVGGELLKSHIAYDERKEFFDKSLFALAYSVKTIHREILQSIYDEIEANKRLEKNPLGNTYWWYDMDNDLTLNVVKESSGLYHVSLSGEHIGNIEGSYTLIDELIFEEFEKRKSDKIFLSTILLNKIYGLKNIDPLRISIENIIKAKSNQKII